MAIPLAVPFAIQGAMGLGQLVAGLAQDKPKLPEYQIPEAVKDNVNMALNEVNSVSPQAKEAFEQSRQMAQGAVREGSRYATSGASALENAQTVGKQYANTVTDVVRAEQSNRANNLNRLYSARNEYARHEQVQQAREQEIAKQLRMEQGQLVNSALGTLSGAVNAGAQFMLAKELSGNLDPQDPKDPNARKEAGSGNGKIDPNTGLHNPLTSTSNIINPLAFNNPAAQVNSNISTPPMRPVMGGGFNTTTIPPYAGSIDTAPMIPPVNATGNRSEYPSTPYYTTPTDINMSRANDGSVVRTGAGYNPSFYSNMPNMMSLFNSIHRNRF